MKICIIGAGVVGSFLAKKLSTEGYDIAVIDKDKKKVEDLQISTDVAAYNCDAFQEECINKVKDYDLYIVATNRDELNLSVALMLKSIYLKEKILVRVDKDILSKKEIEKFLNIEIINTFHEIYKNIENIIKYPFMTYFNELDEGNFIIFGYKVKKDDGLINRKISLLGKIREKIPFTIALIQRDNKTYLPTGNRVLLEDDEVYILVEKKHLNALIKELNIKFNPIKSVYFLGISELGISLLKKLSTLKSLNLKVFEPNITLCEKVAEILPDIIVLNTKLTDEDTLKNEGIDSADLVISPSYREENILASILAKKLGAKKILALIEHPEYEEIAHSLGIDIPMVSRKLIARKVYRKIKHKGFIDIFELLKNVKVYEIAVNRKLSDKSISQISTGSFVVLGIKRDNKMFIVSGNTILKKGDVLIVLEIEENE